MSVGWDSPRTAELYERFNACHGRYREANEALVEHAELAGDLSVLDVAAGTGRTAEVALARLGAGARVVAYEPARAMREAGEKRLADPRLSWSDTLPEASFDRVLCGAAIWQLEPFAGSLAHLAGLVAPAGALCFTIPALYLGEADEPGGGEDPLLAGLYARLPAGGAARSFEPLPGAGGLEALLEDAGLRPKRWSFVRRMTQPELRDWLAIPPLTDRLLAGLDPDARLSVLDDAYARVDAASWRWERWHGWTAWRPS
jgi:SAM-dependent methyltransferase